MPNNKQPDIIAAILRSEKYEIDEGKNNLYAAYERGQKKFISLLQEEAAEKSFWEARIAFVGEIRELWPKKNEQQGEKKPHQIDEEVEREIDLRQKQAIRDHILDEIFFDSSLTLANKLATLSIFLGKLDQFSLRGQESGRGRDIFDQICPAISKALNRESIPKDLDADSLNHLNALADRFKNLTDGVDGDHGLAAVSRLQNSIIFWKGLTLAEHEGFTQVRSRIAEQCKSETFELLSGDDLGHFFNLARAIHQAPDDPMCDQAADRIVQHVIDSSIVGALQSDQDIACFAKYYSDCMHPSIYDDPNLPIFQFPIGIKKFVEFAKAVSKIAKDNEIGKKALEDLSHIFSITIHVKGFVVEDLNHVAEFADICSQFQEYGKCVAALDEIGKVIRRIPADRITAGAAPALFSLTRSFERLSPNVAFRDGALDHLLSDVIPAVASNLGSMDVQAGAIADFLEHISSDITPAAVSPADWSSVMTSAMANFSEVGRRYLALPHIAPEQKLRMLTNYATISAVEQDSHDDRRGRTSLIVQDFKLEELTSLSTEAHANVFKLAECCHPYVEEDKNCEMAFSAIVTALWRNPAVLENKGILPETLSRAAKLIVNSPKEGKDSVEGLKTVSTLAAGLTPLSDQDPNLKSAAGWIASLCNPETIKQLKGDELVCFFPVSGLLYRFGNDHACGKADKEMIAHVESADLSGTAEKTRSLYARYCMDHKLISSPDLSPEDEIVKGAQILAKVKPLPDTDKNLHDLAYAIATEFNDLSDEDVEGITQEQIAELDECFTSLHATPFRHSASDAIKEYFEAANRRKIEKRLKEEALESAYRALPESYNLYNDAGKHFLDCLLAAMPHLDSGQLFMYVLVMNNEQVRDGVSNEERIAINRRGLAVLDAAAKRYVDISRKKASASALSEVSGAKSSLAEQTSDMSLFMRLIARRSDKSADCRAACVTIAGQFADYAFKDLARVAPNDLIVLVEVLANLSAETTCARALDHLLTYFSQMNHELITSDALELFANEAERILHHIQESDTSIDWKVERMSVFLSRIGELGKDDEDLANANKWVAKELMDPINEYLPEANPLDLCRLVNHFRATSDETECVEVVHQVSIHLAAEEFSVERIRREDIKKWQKMPGIKVKPSEETLAIDGQIKLLGTGMARSVRDTAWNAILNFSELQKSGKGSAAKQAWQKWMGSVADEDIQRRFQILRDRFIAAGDIGNDYGTVNEHVLTQLRDEKKELDRADIKAAIQTYANLVLQSPQTSPELESEAWDEDISDVASKAGADHEHSAGVGHTPTIGTSQSTIDANTAYTVTQLFEEYDEAEGQPAIDAAIEICKLKGGMPNRVFARTLIDQPVYIQYLAEDYVYGEHDEKLVALLTRPVDNERVPKYLKMIRNDVQRRRDSDVSSSIRTALWAMGEEATQLRQSEDLPWVTKVGEFLEMFPGGGLGRSAGEVVHQILGDAHRRRHLVGESLVESWLGTLDARSDEAHLDVEKLVGALHNYAEAPDEDAEERLKDASKLLGNAGHGVVTHLILSKADWPLDQSQEESIRARIGETVTSRVATVEVILESEDFVRVANGFLQLISASRSNSRDAADFSDQSWWERKFPQMPQPLRDLAHSMQHFYKLHPETPVPSDAARARQDISTNLQSYKDRYLQQELSKQKADVLGGLLQKVKNELESLKQKEQKAIREQRRDALHQRLNAEAKQLNKGLQDDTVKQGGAVMELLKSVLETRQRIARERGEDEARIEAARQLKGSLAELNIKGADSKTLTAMMHRAFAENISLDSSGDTLDTLHARLKQKCDRELKRMNNGADAVADPLIQRSLEIAEAKDDTTRAILTARLVNDFPGWNQEAVAGLLINDVEWRESISEREPQLKTEAAKTTQALKTLEYDFDAVGASKTDAANCLETIKAIIRAAAEHGPEEEFPSSNWQDRLSRVPQEARDCVGAVRAACLSNFTDVPHTDISDFKSMSDIQDWAKWVNRENLKDAYLESTKEFLEDVQRTLPAGRDSLESSGFTKEAEEIEEAIATLAHTQAERQSVLSPPPSQKSGDEDSRPQTPGSKLPSYQKTLEELSPVERDAVRQEINGAYVLKDFISTSYSIFPMKKFQNAWLVNHAEGGKKSENAFLIPMNWISETDKRRFEAYSGDAPIRFSPSRQDKEKKVDTSITRNLGGRGR